MVVPSQNSRTVAFDLINAVLKRHRPLDDVLEEYADFSNLEPRERAFARNLAATTLRRLGQIDDLINHCMERPLPRRAIAVRDVLRLGVCQLIFLRTPAHAAVDTTVSMLDEINLSPYKKLVNAIMRRLSREGEKLLKSQDAERLNTPEWLWKSWTNAYGKGACRRIAAVHLREPSLDITAKENAETWAANLDATMLATGTLRLAKTSNVTLLAGFDEGAWWVQDASAALPVALLGDVKGKHVIDLCAAPGGKTAQLISRGATVIAVERSAKRLKRLEENLSRLNMTAEAFCCDAAQWTPSNKADAVLLDAPCSSTGAIRRHPDIPHLKKSEDVEKLSNAQFGLLEAALEMVKPGGRVVFCTCSLQPEEGPELIEKILEAHSSFRLDAVKPEEIGGLEELIVGEGTIRCLPCHLSELGGMDGFFIARLIRD
jgi:16S rRNA (cytosine967-C5)-methyltransferase